MRERVRNEPDTGPAAEGVVVTYSRLPRGKRGPAERQEPILEAHEVPPSGIDLRAYDPDRATLDDFDVADDDLGEPRRRRGRGARGAVLVGAIALAAGMVILAYAYGVATRVDTSAPSGAAAVAPAGTAETRGTLAGDNAAGATPGKDQLPDSAAVPMPATAPADAKTPPPVRSASAPQPSGIGGVPMDGDTGRTPKASGHAQPALVAPVPTTATPAAPGKAGTATAKTSNVKPVDAKSADAKPVDANDALMTNIERLLKRDGTTAGTSGPSGGNPAASTGPTQLTPASAPAGSAALPQLPQPDATAQATPPADVGPQPASGVPIPPANIPNVAPGNTGTGLQ